MPLLAAFIGGLIEQLVVFFGAYVAKKFVVALATMTVIAGLWAAMYLAVKAAFGAVGLVVPQPLVQACALIKPDGLEASVTAYLAASLAMAGYRWVKQGTGVGSDINRWGGL